MATASKRSGAGHRYYTTSHALGTVTTSTPTLMMWRSLNEYMLRNQLPMRGDDLSAESGMSIEQLDVIFEQTYYQKAYGFRRFGSLEEWRTWAEESELLFVPGLHDLSAEEPMEEPELETDPEEDED